MGVYGEISLPAWQRGAGVVLNTGNWSAYQMTDGTSPLQWLSPLHPASGWAVPPMQIKLAGGLTYGRIKLKNGLVAFRAWPLLQAGSSATRPVYEATHHRTDFGTFLPREK